VKVSRIGGIGAGWIGSRIAEATATAGIETTRFEVSPAAPETARAKVETGRVGVLRAVERGIYGYDRPVGPLATVKGAGSGWS